MRYVKIKSQWQGHSDCSGCGVRQSALFADLREEDLSSLHETIDDLEFERNAVMYHMGASADCLFTVRRGAVKLLRYTPDGTQRIVRVLRPGDVAGIEALLQRPYQHTAVTAAPTAVCRIPVEVVEGLNRSTPRLHRRLMDKWHTALSEADAWPSELAAGSAPVRARMARMLLRLRLSAESDLALRLALEDIGAILGIKVETASRALSALRRDGFIVPEDRERQFYRLDVASLELEAMGEVREAE